MTILEKIRAARLGGMVERCHGIPHHGSYTNGHHTWNVMILLWYLFPDRWHRVAAHVMAHDVPEAIFGDIPATVMRYCEGLRPRLHRAEAMYLADVGLPDADLLDEEDYRAYKSCDALELYCWCLEQKAMGNEFVEECRRELEHFFEERELPESAANFLEELKSAPFSVRQSRVAKHYLER